MQTSDTGGDKTDTSKRHCKILSQKTFRMEKMSGAGELRRLFATGMTDAANKPNHFHCRVCREEISVLTQRNHEVMRHFHVSPHFGRDLRLRPATPEWRVLDFHGKSLNVDDLKPRLWPGQTIFQLCHAPIVSAWISYGCCECFRVFLLFLVGAICWLTSTVTTWTLARSQAGWEPNFWPQVFDEMPAKGVIVRFQEFRSLFHDGIRHHQAEESRAPRMCDITFWFSSCHRYWRAVDAIST